jgi:hypothetical protein
MTKKPLTPAQEHALDRDGDGHAGGSPKGGNHKAAPKAKTPAASDSVQGGCGRPTAWAPVRMPQASRGAGAKTASAPRAATTRSTPGPATTPSQRLRPNSCRRTPCPSLNPPPARRPASRRTRRTPARRLRTPMRSPASRRRASPGSASAGGTFDHIELHVSELAVFIRAEAEAPACRWARCCDTCSTASKPPARPGRLGHRRAAHRRAAARAAGRRLRGAVQARAADPRCAARPHGLEPGRPDQGPDRRREGRGPPPDQEKADSLGVDTAGWEMKAEADTGLYVSRPADARERRGLPGALGEDAGLHQAHAAARAARHHRAQRGLGRT